MFGELATGGRVQRGPPPTTATQKKQNNPSDNPLARTPLVGIAAKKMMR